MVPKAQIWSSKKFALDPPRQIPRVHFIMHRRFETMWPVIAHALQNHVRCITCNVCYYTTRVTIKRTLVRYGYVNASCTISIYYILNLHLNFSINICSIKVAIASWPSKIYTPSGPGVICLQLICSKPIKTHLTETL